MPTTFHIERAETLLRAWLLHQQQASRSHGDLASTKRQLPSLATPVVLKQRRGNGVAT